MGAMAHKSKNKVRKLKTVHDPRGASKSQNKENSLEKINEVDYGDDVIEAANLAIAIQKEDYTTNIELSLACENLPRMDTFSQSDPMIVVYLDKEDKWVEFGKTEVIPETIFPKFMKTFVVSYNFEKQQKLRFEIYDIDSFQDKNDLDKQDYIGFVETDLHEIVCSPTQSIYKAILNHQNKRRKNGTLIVKGCEFDINSSKYVFKFSAKDLSSKAELFLRVYTYTENQEFVPVTSTDAMKNSKKNCYEWSPIVVASAKILNESDLIRFELCEFNKNKGNLLLGECEVNLDKLLKKQISFLNILKNNNVILGQLHIEVNKIVRHTFLNYIYAGTEVSLIVGIDFSKSNKDSLENESLHKFTETQENDYMNALKSIVGILQYYDHDNKIPVYGFGAKLPPCHSTVSQCFALNGNFFNPEIYGLEDVLSYYKKTVKSVKFHGPQIFNEILKLAGLYASAEEITSSNQKYYILLMVTNGLISDLEFTMQTIRELSVLPLSIIIVGIGEGYGKNLEGVNTNYFSLLQDLRNIPGSHRDIVQFVKFNDVKDEMEKIAKETLASVPKQFLEFMDKNKIEPLVSNDNSMKNTSRDFKQMKIEEMKLRMKSQAGLLQEIAPSFLLEMKASLSNKLVKDFHYDPDLVDYLMNLKGLPANDINLVFQLIDEVKKKLKSKNRSLTPISIVDKKESEEADLKNKFFIKNPYVKHRFFRSRNGKNYNFYEKIKKKSENLDETKRVLDMQNKRIYETSLYDKKPIHKGKNNSIEESPQNSPNKSNIMKNEFESAIKVAQKNEIEIKESQSEIKLNPKKKKIKARIFRHTKKENINNYDDLFYDPGKGSLDCNLCIMCQQTKIEILSLPCGHSCSCQDCFLKSDGLCLFCNSKVKNYVLIEILKKKTIEKFDEDEEN